MQVKVCKGRYHIEKFGWPYATFPKMPYILQRSLILCNDAESCSWDAEADWRTGVGWVVGYFFSENHIKNFEKAPIKNSKTLTPGNGHMILYMDLGPLG